MSGPFPAWSPLRHRGLSSAPGAALPPRGTQRKGAKASSFDPGVLRHADILRSTEWLLVIWRLLLLSFWAHWLCALMPLKAKGNGQTSILQKDLPHLRGGQPGIISALTVCRTFRCWVLLGGPSAPFQACWQLADIPWTGDEPTWS